MIIPFLNFAGRAAEAIAFYETVFAVTDKNVAYFRDMPADMKERFPPETDGYVMHCEMALDGTPVWIGDTTQGITPGDMVTLAVPFATAERVQAAFDKLKAGGKVRMEPAQTFYSPLFGVVEDRFGVIWHLIARQGAVL